jgi:uncharacterized glyoxalase superfamily protein PhnB
VLPHVVYRDVDSAAAWLRKTFGFEEDYRYGDPVQGVLVHLDQAWVMLTIARQGRSTPAQCGAWTQMLTVFVEDIDGHYRRVKSGGAKIVEELNETGYGERQFAAEDLDGHRWLFSRHVRDVSPAEWGAMATES